jgi:hypothetical protein
MQTSEFVNVMGKKLLADYKEYLKLRKQLVDARKMREKAEKRLGLLCELLQLEGVTPPISEL